MSKHGIIRRYTLEIEKIKTGFSPSFEEIKDYLYDYGFDISSRTLQRDIEQIRFEFGLDIKYDRDKNGYYIDYVNSINIDSFFRFLEIVNTAELLTESLSDSKDSMKYISFDMGGGMKGIEYLKPILQAIRERKVISFDHYNYAYKSERSYTLQPYLLKEYANRWYVVGYFGEGNKSTTFGVDRMSNLQLTTETFTRDEKLDPSVNFVSTIGLMYSAREVEKVVLSFTPLQGEYVKSLPWHISQEIMLDNKEECRIALWVSPNFELLQKILTHGDSVTVIEPKWLQDEVVEALELALKNYK